MTTLTDELRDARRRMFFLDANGSTMIEKTGDQAELDALTETIETILERARQEAREAE